VSAKQNTKWFETWFDSPYYHILYKHRNCNEAEELIDHLIDYFNPPKQARFLDLACGKGRHSVFLNKKGFDVTGIDLSPESIKHASACENEHLHFYVHDMRKLFRTNYFDYVINLFTSFGYFESAHDDNATINAVTKALKPQGIFVLDFFNADKIIPTIKPHDSVTVNGITFTIDKKVENGFIIKQISFSDKGTDYRFEERVKALTLEHFKKYFSANGLKIIHLWGDYQLGDFNIETSERLIIAAKKE
jgi:SAM-dependent methyltransferase